MFVTQDNLARGCLKFMSCCLKECLLVYFLCSASGSSLDMTAMAGLVEVTDIELIWIFLGANPPGEPRQHVNRGLLWSHGNLLMVT